MTIYYNIVADFDIYGKIRTCMVYGGYTDREKALETLERITTNPNDNDIHAIGTARNLRLEATTETPWWYEGTN